jgi:DNA-binding transcriptional ArsR family regulator
MSKSKIDERLQRLTESGACSCETVSKYADELKELANEKLSFENSKAKSKVFKALSDPIRLRILGLLSSREMCVCEVMVALELTQPTASHHLRILENVGLVKDRKEGKWVFYSIGKPDFFEGMRKLEIF